MLVLVPLVIFVTLVIQKYNQPFKADWRRALSGQQPSESQAPVKRSGPCITKECPSDQISFYMHSGAANVVPGKICVHNTLVLGSTLNNAGVGINIVVVDGKTGKVTDTNHFDMYSGEVKPLISFLNAIEAGSIVLIASFDEPATKLDNEAKRLITELGSSSIGSLGFRDSWLFVGPCITKECPSDQISFYMHSGAANVVPGKICVHNTLVLGSTLNNAGVGINIVVVDGKTGKVTDTNHFDMYSGEVKPLISFLNAIEAGSIVLIASFDEPATKLDNEAKRLITELGSSSIGSLGFRDSWLFVGAKGAAKKSLFEKHTKNDKQKNIYDGWPELIYLTGCIPK
ncbi:unnamed protein product, partial [Tetraodon nigroviridis]